MPSSQTREKLPPIPIWKRLTVARRMLTVERVCIFMIVLLLVYGIVAVPYLIELLGYYRKNGVTFYPSYLLIVIPGFICSRVLYLFSAKYLAPRLQPYFVDESRKDARVPLPVDEETVRKVGNCIYGTIYYATSVTVLMGIIIQDNLLPTQLFGAQNPDNFCLVWPEQPSVSLQIFYMATLSHHIERLYYEFVDNSHAPTFYTMVYHHLLTIFLVGTSFWPFLHKYGVFILITHDFTDILLNFGRVVKVLMRGNWLKTIIMALLIISWAWLRLAVFIRVVLVSMTKCYWYPESSLRRFFIANILFLPALTTLACLNAFWFIQMLKVAYDRLVRGEYQIPYLERKESDRQKSD